MNNEGKPNKRRRISLAITIITVALAAAIIITNFFIPVKYLTAYLVARKDKNADGAFRITFIDVGYGDCTLVEFPDGKCALIDAGDGTHNHELNVLKTLNRRAIDKIDYLFCTSVRKERSGGLAEILCYKQVDKVFVPYCKHTQINDGYAGFYNQLNVINSNISNEQDRTKAEYTEYGAGVFEDEYLLCVLSPSAHTLEGGDYDKLNKDPTDKNVWDSSAVIYIEYQSVGILLCGDLSNERQHQLLTEHPEGEFATAKGNISIRNTRIIKAAHNGYKGAECAELYDFIQPYEGAAVISVGENGMDSPSAGAVANAQLYVGDKLYRTDVNGTVTFTVADGDFSVVKERK